MPLPQPQGIGLLIYHAPAAASGMQGFHLTMSPLLMIAPKVKISQWDKEQSKKQFTLLTISSLPRGAVEDICALEGERSQPSPSISCSGAGIKGLRCPSPGSGDCNVHRSMVQSPRASGAWTPWRGQLMRCGSAGSIRITQFLILASHSPSPSVYRTFLMVSFGNASFLVGTPRLCSPYATTIEGLKDEFIKQACILLYLIAFFPRQIVAIFCCLFKGW